jgi:hypothetical protein
VVEEKRHESGADVRSRMAEEKVDREEWKTSE